MNHAHIEGGIWERAVKKNGETEYGPPVPMFTAVTCTAVLTTHYAEQAYQ